MLKESRLSYKGGFPVHTADLKPNKLVKSLLGFLFLVFICATFGINGDQGSTLKVVEGF